MRRVELTSRHDVATANNTFAEQQFEVYSFFLGMSSLTNSFLGGRHRFHLIYMNIECINLVRDTVMAEWALAVKR